jgi:RND family efflux transporter MFP subunit
MKTLLPATTTLALALLCAPATATTAAAAADSLGCLIGPSRTAEIGSPVVGVLHQVHVERGDAVTKGQILATLRADVERAQVGLAGSRAKADGELQAAQKAHDFALSKRKRADDLFRQEFISRQALDTAIAEAEVAEARLAQSREQSRHTARELDLAAAQLSMRVIRSPIDGVVIDRFLDAGERVDDRPILKVATVRPLRVEVVLPATLYGKLAVGDRVQVRPDLASLPTVHGTASVVDRVIDPASNTFRARLELPNTQGELPPGARCKATLVAAPVNAVTPANPAAGTVAPASSTAPVAHRAPITR